MDWGLLIYNCCKVIFVLCLCVIAGIAGHGLYRLFTDKEVRLYRKTEHCVYYKSYHDKYCECDKGYSCSVD